MARQPRFTGTLERGLLGHMQYIIVPEKIARPLHQGSRPRILAEFDNGKKLHCALHHKNDLYYIYLGKSSRDKTGLRLGDKVTVTLRADTSEFGMEIPEELKELLLLDPEGERLFLALTPGKQRTVIHYIQSAKAEATRINRALRIVENLKLGFTHPRDLLRRHT